MSLLRRLKKRVFSHRYQSDYSNRLYLYRCSECGFMAWTKGGLHGHIEGHRRIWNLWRIGWDIDFLSERTEEIILEPVEVTMTAPMD